jgi:hypothetical protein
VRYEDAYALLLQYGSELALALPGGSGPARVTALWLALLSAAARRPGGGELAAEWAGALRQWAAATPGVDGAALEAALLALTAAGAAAAGDQAAALRKVAAAVRAAPWLAPLRTRLAQHALQASPWYAAAVARACPPASAADAEAAARGGGVSAHAALADATPAAAAAVAADDGGKAPPPAFVTPDGAALGGAFTLAPCPELAVPAAAAASATGIANATAAAVAQEAGAATARLQALLRVSPGSAGLWALLATVSLQRAAATGQCRHHRHALACCVGAEKRLAALLAASPAPPPASAAALSAVRTRMLAGASESHMYTRLPGCVDAAARSARAAVEAAAGGDAAAGALAQRQSARVLWVQGRLEDAEAAYRRAAAAGDACSQLELAKLLVLEGRADEAAKLLSALRPGGGGGDGGRFEASAALEEAVVLAGLSDLAGARAAAAAALASAEARSSGGRAAAAAAHVATADVALCQGRATLPDLAKNLLLEARFHAAAAARLAVALPGNRGLATAGAAAVLLAGADKERGRGDRAVEPLAAGLAAYAEAGGAVPAALWELAGDVLGDAAALQRAVHTDPTCGAAWRKMGAAAAAAAAAAGGAAAGGVGGGCE